MPAGVPPKEAERARIEDTLVANYRHAAEELGKAVPEVIEQWRDTFI